jgi:hypothetical protein
MNNEKVPRVPTPIGDGDNEDNCKYEPEPEETGDDHGGWVNEDPEVEPEWKDLNVYGRAANG